MMGKAKSASYGVVPPHAFRKALKQVAAGRATEILREYEPLFGETKCGDQLRLFTVTVWRHVERTDEAKIEVEARDEEHAEVIIGKMNDGDFQWKYWEEDVVELFTEFDGA